MKNWTPDNSYLILTIIARGIICFIVWVKGIQYILKKDNK